MHLNFFLPIVELQGDTEDGKVKLKKGGEGRRGRECGFIEEREEFEQKWFQFNSDYYTYLSICLDYFPFLPSSLVFSTIVIFLRPILFQIRIFEYIFIILSVLL